MCDLFFTTRHERVKIENIALSKDNAKVKRNRKKTNRRIKYHKDPLNDVINLTSKTFSFNQFELLYENLNVPTPTIYKKTQFKNDIDSLIRKVNEV